MQPRPRDADPRVAAHARAAGIVDGTSGAPRPLDQRLAWGAARRVRVVIASAVDGEPHVATARRLAAARPDELVLGLEAARAATGAERGVVAVERRAREAARAIEAAIPRDAPIRVARVPDVAACHAAADLAHDAAGMRVSPGDDPIEHGALILEAAALIDLSVAARARGEAGVVARAVSVAGDVARPGVYTLPIGISVEDAVAAAGGATAGPAWIALGDGPMTGRPLDRDDPITKATRALVVVAAASDLARRARVSLADHVRRAMSACERCSMCADVCPPRLLGGRLRPDEITRALSNARVGWDELAAAIECQSCGLCDAACPIALSPRRLVESVARAVSDRSTIASGASGALHPERDARRLSIDLVARRLGLGDRAFAPPWNPVPVEPAQVSIPLKQSLGVAARPIVSAGDRVSRGQPIAKIPDGALGAPAHASIDGEVLEAGASITIARVTASR